VSRRNETDLDVESSLRRLLRNQDLPLAVLGSLTVLPIYQQPGDAVTLCPLRLTT
jgi:hypothetical protein